MQNGKSLSAQLSGALNPGVLLPTLVAGLVCGILNIVIALSFAAMIFSGKLSAYTSQGIGFLLAGTIVLGIVTALLSKVPGIIGCTQDGPAAIIAVMAGTIAAEVSAIGSPERSFITSVMIIVITSLVTGLCFLLIGRFRLGNLIRYVPYPVLGGFLAGTGYFLLQGGFGVMADENFSLQRLPFLLSSENLLRWLPGIILGIALLLILRVRSHFLIIPGTLAIGVIVFYLILLFTGTPVEKALQQKLLLGPFPAGGLWQLPDFGRIGQVDWQIVLSQSGRIFTAVLVSTVSVLLNLSGLEIVAKQDIALNRELQVSGLVNIILGFFGSSPGYIALSQSSLAIRLGARNRFPGIIVGLLAGATLLAGTSVLTLVPKFILGGLLFFLGLSFLVEWLYDGWFRLRKTDYVIILCILGVMSAIGVMEGVIVGLLFATILFVIDYSRLNVVKHTFSGKSYRSHVEYSLFQETLLAKQGDQIHILELQGYLFFGVADSLLTQVRARFDDKTLSPLRYLILDFRQTTGFDISAVISFQKIKQLATSGNFTLLFTSVGSELRKSLEREVFKDSNWQVFESVDRAAEWCEAQILKDYAEAGIQQTRRPRTQFSALFPDTDNESFPELMLRRSLNYDDSHVTKNFAKYFERQELSAGTSLVQQGTVAEGIYFVESGQVEVVRKITKPDSPPSSLRLRTMGTGTVVGEVSVYNEEIALASTVAIQPTVVHFISLAKIQEMEKNDPAIAMLFHKLMASLTSAQLFRAVDILDNLMMQ